MSLVNVERLLDEVKLTVQLGITFCLCLYTRLHLMALAGWLDRWLAGVEKILEGAANFLTLTRRSQQQSA